MKGQRGFIELSQGWAGFATTSKSSVQSKKEMPREMQLEMPREMNVRTGLQTPSCSVPRLVDEA